MSIITYKTQNLGADPIANNKSFFMVFKISAGLHQRDCDPTVRHETLEEACIEAKRLAAKHPDRKFVVLKAIGIMHAEVTVNEQPLN
jgi:hypothetical protein